MDYTELYMPVGLNYLLQIKFFRDVFINVFIFNTFVV